MSVNSTGQTNTRFPGATSVPSPALAIAWEFARRHRWGFASLAAYLLFLGTRNVLVLEPGQAVAIEGDDVLSAEVLRFVTTVTVPGSILAYYFVAVFSFGLTGNMAARESMYPARMFALPVSTTALAFWPALYGTATIAGLVLAATRFALWPSGLDVPLIWPALLGAVSLAWAQALMWMPFGLPGLRVGVAVVLLVMIDGAVAISAERRVPEWVLVAALAPQLPLAWLAARVGVARARRGDVPDWRPAIARIAGALRMEVHRARVSAPFQSAARAQLWFEWRLHGRSLPVWVALLLPFELAFLWVAGTNTPDLVAYTLAGALLTPPFMAAFSAPSVRRSDPHARDAYGMPPFMATRPVSTAALVAARLKVTMWSTTLAWLLVGIAIPLALTLSGTWPVVRGWARDLGDVIGAPRVTAVVLLGVAGLVAATWKQLVQSLYIGMSGRMWLVRLGAGVTMTTLIFIEPIGEWIHDSAAVRIALWNALPWVLAALVVGKTLAAALVARHLEASRLLSDRALVTGAACWLAAVLLLYGVLVWLLLGPLIPRYYFVLLATLAVPLARVSAAPLALAWNRHR